MDGQFRMKSATVIDRSQEIEELKQKLEKLTTTVQSNSFKGARPKEEKKEDSLRTGLPKTKSPRKEDPRNMNKGLATTSAGPFKPNQKHFSVTNVRDWDMVGRNVPQRETWIGRGYTGSPKKRQSLKKINSKPRSNCPKGIVS